MWELVIHMFRAKKQSKNNQRSCTKTLLRGPGHHGCVIKQFLYFLAVFFFKYYKYIKSQTFLTEKTRNVFELSEHTEAALLKNPTSG